VKKSIVFSSTSLESMVNIADKVATGVDYVRAGRKHTVRCRREIVLSAGAIASPKLLMLSGIGPGDALQNLGIEVKVHSPGVGRNLQEHPGILLFQNVNIRTLNTEVTPLRVTTLN
jgi:choline dehydrogenase